NLYGDILSDLGAALVGGLGLAASANIHPGRGGAGLFEPVHGSAPPLAGKGIANPMAAVLAGGLMLEQLGAPEAARDLERAELEQGLAARGTGSLREETSWDVNLKVGVSRHLQIGLFGPVYARTASGDGVRDLGVALKLRSDLSPRAAVAVVSSVTVPTGSA